MAKGGVEKIPFPRIRKSTFWKTASVPWKPGWNGSIESMKALPEEEIRRVLDNLRERWGVDPALQSRDFLTWDEVREMHRSGLVSFGSHTETHRILTTLRDDEIVRELRRSKERLAEEGVAGSSFFPFAYPNGNHSDNIIRFVKEHGYSLAVTTRKGWVRYADCGNHIHAE